jgi:hypothetical protein
MTGATGHPLGPYMRQSGMLFKPDRCGCCDSGALAEGLGLVSAIMVRQCGKLIPSPIPSLDVARIAAAAPGA